MTALTAAESDLLDATLRRDEAEDSGALAEVRAALEAEVTEAQNVFGQELEAGS